METPLEMKVLTFVNYYLPGSRGGGPIRSIANLVRNLGGELDFIIVTTDRDFQDAQAYAGVVPGQSRQVGKAHVLYLPERAMRPWRVRRLVAGASCDVIYLNSFFHPRYSIQVLLLRYLGLIPRIPLVLAPRGELSAGALAIKKWKKRLYIALAEAIGLYKNVVWQASSVHEEREIRAIFGSGSTVVRAPVLVVPDMLNPDAAVPEAHRTPKASGKLRIAFLSRITRKKNLDGALRLLSRGLEGDVELNIYGGIDDAAYWAECQRLVEALPGNIRAHYAGPISHADVPRELARNDLFFLPTHGENFGHVVVEALMAGCLVLISDRTPWGRLEELGIGWSVPLERPERFVEALQQMVAMDSGEFAGRSRRAVDYGVTVTRDPETLRRNRELFQVAVGLQQQ